MQQSGEATKDQIRRLRALNEGEKLSLIFTQHRKLGEYEDRLESLQCSHQTGTCPLCLDKDVQIQQLQQQNDQLRSKLYGRSSEQSAKGKKPGNGGKNSGNPKGGSSERTRLPSERFPNAQVQEFIQEDPAPPMCDECAQPMTDSGMTEDPTEKIEYQAALLFITRTRRKKYHCKCCECAPKTAALPERIAPGSHIGDSLIIQACISKFYDLIPTTRFSKILARGKAAIAHTLLLKAQSWAAFMQTQIYVALRQEILEGRVVLADETIHRQLEENNGNWRWYLWGFSNRTSIYFEIHDTRAGDVSIQFLLESVVLFLMSDAYSGYTRTIREVNEHRKLKGLPLLQSSLCNDHGRRYFFYAKEDPLAQKAVDTYDEIYKIESKVQELLKNPQYAEPENSAEALKLRQTADPLFEQIHDLSCEILMNAPEKSLEQTAAKYFINHEKGLILYLQHIEIPISNAPAERGLRDWVQLRKTSLGNHSLAGAEEAAIQLSVMCSCKMAEVNPQEYLEFTRLRYLAKQPLLTPAKYKQFVNATQKAKPPDSS
jgi:transposase